MRILSALLLTLTLLFSANPKDIHAKIKQNKTTLEDKKRQEERINAKLQELGNAINQQEKEGKELEKVIQKSEKSIEENKKEYITKQALIKNLLHNQDSLFQTRKKIEAEIIELLLKDISFVILLNDFQPESIQDLVTEESFKALSNATKNHLKELSTRQSHTITLLKDLQNEISVHKEFIDKENKKREQLKELQNKQIELIANYQKEVKKYNDELQKIVKEREAIAGILAELNIIKSQEEKKEEKKSAQQTAKETPKQTTKEPSTPPLQTQEPKPTQTARADFDVRQVANSYHDISTTKYKGAKTIAPLEHFAVEKRFGPYFDPVYKMKVFNESVILTPKGDDKVRSVLDGKVVFAKDTPILKRVVIIEHKDNMHTIYAQLDKIAPTIKPGRAVKKGYTIGRVDNALKFEVTLKDKHIDPLELIQTKNL